jgi:hypothetical protein
VALRFEITDAHASDWCRQCLLSRPAIPESMLDRSPPDARPLGPLRQAQRFPMQRQNPAIATVPGLFFSRGPANVLWFVVPIVVDPLYGVLGGRTAPDVGQELFKATAPALADRDAPSAVAWIRMIGWAQASPFDFGPTGVLRRWSRPSRCLPVAGYHATSDRIPLHREPPFVLPTPGALARCRGFNLPEVYP